MMGRSAALFSILVCAFAAAVGPASARAQHFDGHVVGIVDGDTLDVLLVEGGLRSAVRIRLAEIDAPERGAPFGQAAQGALSQLCYARPVRGWVFDVDSLGRVVAIIECAGINANHELVRLGLAWVYDRYVLNLSLYEVEAEAAAAGRGLWADPRSIPPWVWRSLMRGR